MTNGPVGSIAQVQKNNPKGEVPSGLVSAGYPLGRKHPSKENVPQNHRVIFDMDQASTDQRWGFFFGTDLDSLGIRRSGDVTETAFTDCLRWP